MKTSLVKETMFLSYLSYHTRDEIDNLNKYGTLNPNTPAEWVKLWDEIKDNIDKIELYDCLDYNIPDAQFIYTHDKEGRLFIAFRGTKSFSDILTDITAINDKFIDICYSPYYLTHERKSKSLPYVHDGFYKICNLLKYKVANIIDKYLNTYYGEGHKYQIILTGHSMGAVASILTSVIIYCYHHKLIDNDTLRLYNITYGAPKSGNYEFSRVYKDWIKNSWHFYHSCDPIPYLPPIKFYSVCNEIKVDIDENNKFKMFSLEYHFLGNYIKYIAIMENEIKI